MHGEPDEQEQDALSRAAAAKTFRRLLPYLRPHRRTLLVAAAISCVITVCFVAGPVILGAVVDTVREGDPGRALPLLAGAFFLTFGVAFALGYLQQLQLSRMGLRIITALKERVFGHLLRLSTRYHDRNTVGRLIARTENDSENVKELFSRVAIQLFQSALVFVAMLSFMLARDYRTTFFFLVLVPLLALGTVWFFRTIRQVYRRARRRYAELSGTLTEYVQGVPVVQQFDQADRALELLDERNLAKYRADMRGWILDYTFWGGFLFVEVLAAVALLFLGVPRVVGGELTLGDLIMFLELTRRVFEPIMQMGEQLTQVQRALASADRVFDILDSESEVKDRPGAAGSVRLEDGIRFENVSYSYDGKERVLEDVSFTIPRGRRVALVGPSGGGKTTLVGLLCRFLEPTAGRILVDGRDLREFTQKAWRDQVGLVLQEIYLFPGTVLDNLRVLDQALSEEAVRSASRAVAAEERILELAGGYGADLAERGANLSLGERQLLSFARALTKDPELLVLDEATSSVDPGTELRIQASLERLLAGRTALIVAHRLSTIRSADRILVVKGGRIREEGDHDSLYAGGGLYRELYDLQTLGNGRRR